MSSHSLFAKKPLSILLEEALGEGRLRRVLGPLELTALGIGAVIGTGIFVLTGVVKVTEGPAPPCRALFGGFQPGPQAPTQEHE